MKFLDPRLLRFSRSSRGYLLVSAILAFLNTVLTLLQAYVITSLVTDIFLNHSKSLKHEIYSLIFVMGTKSLLALIYEQTSARIGIAIRSQLREKAMQQINKNGARLVARFGTANISLVLTRGINSLDPYFSKFLPQLFIALSVPPVLAVTIFLNDKVSGFIVLFTLPLIPLFGALIGRFTQSAVEKRWQRLSILSGHFLDVVSGLLTLKTFGRSKDQEERIEASGEAYRIETMKTLRISFLSSLALELIATLSVALIAVSIGLRLVSGNIDLKTGLLILILAPDVYWPLRMVGAHFHSSVDGVTAASTLLDIINEPSPSEGKVILEKIDSIAFSNVQVKYPDRPHLSIPDLSIRRGEFLSIMGRSGVGKTTFAHLLLRFIEPASGSILINDLPIQTYTLDSLRSKIAWVPQNARFFDTSIRENISLGRNISDREITELFEQLNLDLKLDHDLGFVTKGISGGEARRIALVRALLSSASLLLLDEPLSALDQTNADRVMQLLKQVNQSGQTVVVITHRPLSQDGRQLEFSSGMQ